ncbi:glycoside hydrolase family 30 protein [Nocardiopsis nanhaiensis]
MYHSTPRTPEPGHRSPRRGRVPAVLATTCALALGATAVGAATSASDRTDATAIAASAEQSAAQDSASVWMTSPDRSHTLTQQDDVSFTSSPEDIDIAVDDDQREQTFTGAGASVTEASAQLISELPEGERDELMATLFSPEDGIGLSYLRQPLGSTDFNAGDFYTYEDTPGEFSIDRDRQEIIPVVQQALEHNPDIRFMGSPWSPPAWMKTGGSLNGGGLDPDHYEDYADYLVNAIEAYADEGIDLADLTMQNEPLLDTDYPSTYVPADEQAAFFHVLDEALTEAGLDTDLYAYDHNWDEPEYPLEVFEGTEGIDRVQGAAFHCYAGDPSAQSEVVDVGKRVYFTECSGSGDGPDDEVFSDTLWWQSEHLVVGNMRNGGETTVTWNLALDADGGPHQGNCEDRCTGVVEIDGSDITYNGEYYVLGHLAGFVEPGATRIGSTSEGSGGVQNVVFENPDGGKTAFVVNADTEEDHTFSVTEDGASLSYTLPAGSVATFTW